MNKTWVFVGILLQHSVTAQSAITSIGVVRGWSCSPTVGKKSKKKVMHNIEQWETSTGRKNIFQKS